MQPLYVSCWVVVQVFLLGCMDSGMIRFRAASAAHYSVNYGRYLQNSYYRPSKNGGYQPSGNGFRKSTGHVGMTARNTGIDIIRQPKSPRILRPRRKQRYLRRILKNEHHSYQKWYKITRRAFRKVKHAQFGENNYYHKILENAAEHLFHNVSAILLPHKTKIIKFLMARTSCTNKFQWKYDGVRVWPRFFRHSYCNTKNLNRHVKESFKHECSWPPGMECVQEKMGRTIIRFRWHCINPTPFYDFKKNWPWVMQRFSRRRKRNYRRSLRYRRRRQRRHFRRLISSSEREKIAKQLIGRMTRRKGNILCGWKRIQEHIDIRCKCGCT